MSLALTLRKSILSIRYAFSLEEKLWQPKQCFQNQRYQFADKGPYSQSYGFASSHVQMSELDHKEGWAPKNCCFWNVVLEITLESPLDSKEIKPVNPKGNQPWLFFGRTDAEAPMFGPPDVKSWLIWKDPDAGEDWRQEKKGRQRMKLLDGIPDSMDMSLNKLKSWWCTGKPGMLQSMGSQSQTGLSD